MSDMVQDESVVYSKPSCVQCTATYRALDSKGITCRVVDLSETPEALEYVQSIGYLQAPIVVDDDQDHWAGFRPDHIERVAKIKPARLTVTPVASNSTIGVRTKET